MVAFVTANYLLHSSFLPQVKVTRPAGRHAMLHSRVMKASRPITMKSETGEKKESPYKKLEENVQAKKNAEYRGPQGFTPYAELVNGRLAMIGFFTMIVAELFNPSHPSLLKQLELIFPLDKLPFIGSILG